MVTGVDIVGELHDLAGWHGLPGAIEFTLDRLPGSLTADVGYDLAVRFGLLAGDLAAVLEAGVSPGDPAQVDLSRAPGGDGVSSAPDGADDERARKGEGDDGVVASAMVVAALRPVIHPWMVVGPEAVWHAVDCLDTVGPRLHRILRALPLNDSAVEGVCRAVAEARAAFVALARALQTDGAEVRRLTRRPSAARALRPFTDRLTSADVACRDTLLTAAHLVPSVADLLRDTPWAQPSVPLDRAALAALSPEELASALARQPDFLAHVTDPRRADSDVPPWLAPAIREQPDASEDTHPDAESLRRVARVRTACRDQDQETLHRAALLHPRGIGNLDGVPPRWRCLANRLVMRADLDRLREADLGLQDAIGEQRRSDAAAPWRRLRGAVLDAWMSSEKAVSMATMPHDRLAPRRADLRAMIRLTHELLHDRVDHGRGRIGHRQVVEYDPDGRVVELWGHLDEQTRQVGVYVGGTGTTPRQFGWPTGIARALHQAESPETTAVITWMGAEFPNAIGTQSPQGRFARLAAVPLRNCVEGLDIPDDVPVTVVGHSYGGVIVGAAEAVGLRVDRVVHAGVPGIGPGVRSVRSYPDVDGLGRPRRVTRYALTAPGDLIRWWRRGDAAVESAAQAVRFGPVGQASHLFFEATLGADPTQAPGIVELDTGVWETDKHDRSAGEILFGPRGHADVVEPGTTSFRRIVAILHGRDPSQVRPPADLTPFRWRPGR